MNNRIHYSFWQHLKHAVVVGVGLGLVIKSLFVLAGYGTPLTTSMAVIYGAILLVYVPGIPYYIYKTYYKE